MLRLREISLFQFKNYKENRFCFDQQVVGICGPNGVGKTSLLDAIHYLGFTRSYFTRLDAHSVQQGQTGFRLEGSLELNNKIEKVACILRENGKKEMQIDSLPHEKLSQHIGRYPVVVIAPDDANLITGDSRERRSFLDQLLSQLNAQYLQELIVYNRVLQQRNSLLKEMKETGSGDTSLLEVLNAQLLGPGNYIHESRKHLLQDFIPLVQKIYSEIAAGSQTNTAEIPEIRYQSKLLENLFSDLLVRNRHKDLQAQRTTDGIHRDELDIQLGGQSFKILASQGQRKSLLFALKLAEMSTLTQHKGFPPLLLLDDVFEKLDENRILNLLKTVCSNASGQVFITDTNANRLAQQLKKIEVSFQLIDL